MAESVFIYFTYLKSSCDNLEGIPMTKTKFFCTTLRPAKFFSSFFTSFKLLACLSSWFNFNLLACLRFFFLFFTNSDIASIDKLELKPTGDSGYSCLQAGHKPRELLPGSILSSSFANLCQQKRHI